MNLLPIMQHQSTGVAHAAHLGGAAYGIVYKLYDLRFSRLFAGRFTFPKFRFSEMFRRRPRVRMHIPPEDQDLDHEVDRVLEKISREGSDSLTDQERHLLDRASRHYKHRNR